MKFFNNFYRLLIGLLFFGLIFLAGCEPLSPPPDIAYIDNQTADNILVYVDGHLQGIALAGDLSLPADSWNNGDHNIEVKDTVLDHSFNFKISAKDAEKRQTLVISPPNGSPTTSTVALYSKTILVDNLYGGDGIVVFLNKNPWAMLGIHIARNVNFKIPIESTGNFTVQAKTFAGQTIYSEVFTPSEFAKTDNISVGLAPYSLEIFNLTDQNLKAYLNDQFIGDLQGKSDKTFSDLTILPRVTGSFGHYIVEMKDEAGNILYSNDYQWTDLYSKRYKISVPFTLGPKIIVNNKSNDMVTVYADKANLGTVLPHSVSYFVDNDLYDARKVDVGITVESSQGKTLYSGEHLPSAPFFPDFVIEIP
jgi:hypothetical protein